jgi:hypothetical protein
MTVSLPFQQQFTWRKLGYLFFQDSLEYRKVLEQNPQWTVTQLPPIGAQLRITGSAGSAGGLSQGNFVFGLPVGSESDEIYPYDTREAYNAALNRYTLQGVVERQALNGISFDSTQAITGVQKG